MTNILWNVYMRIIYIMLNKKDKSFIAMLIIKKGIFY